VAFVGIDIEYPELRGKIIKQVRFANDEEFTALVMEFEDNTLVSFRLKARIFLLMEPELSTLEDGDIVKWKRLKRRPATLRVLDNRKA
jgi:hypothetical protein